MSTIMLRGIDENVLRSIRIIADRNGVTVDDQARRMLIDVVQPPSQQDLVARLEAIAAMTPDGVSQADSTELLREDRGR